MIACSDRAKKDKRIQKLKQKALERNPNEFTRKMIVTKMQVMSCRRAVDHHETCLWTQVCMRTQCGCLSSVCGWRRIQSQSIANEAEFSKLQHDLQVFYRLYIAIK